MPLIQIDVQDRYSADIHRQLIERCTRRLSEVAGTPLDRFRATVNPFPADCWGISGEADPALVSPMIRITLLQGRALEVVQEMLAVASEVTAEVLGIPLEDVRGFAHEIPRSLWSIGGVPASVVYGDAPVPAPAS